MTSRSLSESCQICQNHPQCAGRGKFGLMERHSIPRVKLSSAKSSCGLSFRFSHVFTRIKKTLQSEERNSRGKKMLPIGSPWKYKFSFSKFLWKTKIFALICLPVSKNVFKACVVIPEDNLRECLPDWHCKLWSVWQFHFSLILVHNRAAAASTCHQKAPSPLRCTELNLAKWASPVVVGEIIVPVYLSVYHGRAWAVDCFSSRSLVLFSASFLWGLAQNHSPDEVQSVSESCPVHPHVSVLVPKRDENSGSSKSCLNLREWFFDHLFTEGSSTENVPWKARWKTDFVATIASGISCETWNTNRLFCFKFFAKQTNFPSSFFWKGPILAWMRKNPICL